MFKYKSPLSRLLEGAGKVKEAQPETDVEGAVEPEAEKPQPIADFNALRNALAGGNASAEPYEDSDELIPEEDMPAFSDDADETVEDEAEATDGAQDNLFEPTEEQHGSNEPVVTLHIATDEDSEQTDAQDESVVEVVVETVEPTQAETVEPILGDPHVETAPEPEATSEPEVTPEPTQAAAPPVADDRRGRVKTTFLGFERADTHVQDLIESSDPVVKTTTAKETFPVGWLVVTAGPGRGSCITLTEGLMQIGRNDDQAIQLDFGDTGISRSNHAVIAYDPEDRKCYLGHGGKANLVRLNGKPVLSTVALSSGDLIRISETSIRFAAFCDDDFDWRDDS
ncbi:FHA domain-containing protein [Ruegeria profundi]|uniref:FHA domain-containing protein n=1 Tax=Ruegeria profundi TaxID=1685378 RepID=UPI001CD50FCC|nr:FHA domain-containing protein [Ruegeria profundi]MCA0928350.1 FHA domain-containing protein [Ruegeria profundi]